MERWRTLFLATTALLAAGPAMAGPDGANVVGGSATITGQGSATVTINQTSNRAIINWQQFNIGAGELTQFNQPNSGSVALNRVTGGLGPTEILGTLRANGRVFVVNRDGVYFGPNAVVDTAGFLATTSDIRNDDFMAGRYNFNIPGRPDASIVNRGTITAHSSGFAALVAPGVRNTGTITATLGTVALASGNSFTLDFYGDKLITLAVGDSIASQVRDVQTGRPLSSLVENAGRLSANGGRVELTAAAARRVVDSVINNRGVIEANRIGTRGGMIVLSAATGSSKPAGAPRQTIRLGGTISAAGKKSGEKGGKVVVSAENIEVTGARIDVSGAAGGGTVLIGGDWGGGNPDKSLVNNRSARLESHTVANAATVTVDSATSINASATESGDGGKVVLWADERMSFAGAIEARGGPQGGDGGFAEVSGKQNLDFRGLVDLRAPYGAAGTLLLDPQNFLVDVVGTTPPPNTSFMSNVDIQNQLANQNVVIATQPGTGDGDIFIFAPITWSNSNSLTFSAHRDINLDDAVITNTGAGNLILRADNQGAGIGTVDFAGLAAVNFAGSTGRVSIYYNPPAYATPTDFTEVGQGTGRGVLNGSQFTPYMLVNSVNDLQGVNGINTNLGGTYALGRNIDNASAPFTPIGLGQQFTGIFDGLGNTISNLNIAPTLPATNNVGLFEWIGAGGIVRNLNLANATITANPNVAGPSQFVGTLAGQNHGQVTNVTATGAIDGLNLTGVIAGGLIGQNGGPFSAGTITNAHANVNVAVGDGSSGPGVGWNYTGGLVGYNYDVINLSSAGNGSTFVAGGNYSFVGGLAGQNNGTISDSNANVIAAGTSGTGSSTAVGGFVGANTGNISTSFASGPVAGDGTVNTIILGGFVGLNGLTGSGTPTGQISNSHATGVVVGVGNGQAGGFAGGNFAEIQSSWASGGVFTTGGTAGGFVGFNNEFGTINDSHAHGAVFVAGLPNADVLAGGFAGENQGHIHGSHATGPVSAAAEIVSVGGFVGGNEGDIGNSSATGAVSGAGVQVSAGGFAGDNNGGIENSAATGNVAGTSSTVSALGGFVGFNEGDVINSQASGGVTASGIIGVAGGFVGLNVGFIDPSFATGNVDVSATTVGHGGGFAGWNAGVIERSFATGTVTGGDNHLVGGFAALNFGELFQVYATGATTGGANSFVAGLVAGNSGSIDQTYAVGFVTGGGGSTRGGLVATANGLEALISSLPPEYQQFVSGSLPNGTVTNSYWDTQSTGQTSSAGGEGRTTNQLISGLPPGFSQDAWNINARQSYPFFIGQSDPIPHPGDHHRPDFDVDFNQAQYLQTYGLTQTVNFEPTVPPPLITPPAPRNTQKKGNQKGGGNTNPNNSGLRPDGRPSNIPPLNETRFISNQVVVQIGANVPPAVLDRIVRRLGLTVLSSQTLGLLGTRLIQFEFASNKNIRDIMRELEKQRIIDDVTANYEFELAQGTTAPSGNGSGDPAQYMIGKLHLVEAHKIATGENIKVAVIDSEIDAKHPDLEGRIEARYEEAGPVDKPHPHGTGMAGAIASHRKLMGTAPAARILAIRAFGGSSGGAKGTTVQIVKGLDWAVGQNARIVNMSFAGPKDPTLAKAFKAAYDRNVVLIAAAGNAGPKSPPLYPGADPNVIAVSATDESDQIYSNSNRGKYISVAAPGVDILVPAPDGNYEFTTGTSVAAAHVSGVAALLLQRDPKLDPATVRELLTSTANRFGAADRNDDVGYGLVDPLKALQRAGARTSSLPPPGTVAAAR